MVVARLLNNYGMVLVFSACFNCLSLYIQNERLFVVLYAYKRCDMKIIDSIYLMLAELILN